MKSYYAARAAYYDAVYLLPERAADLAFLQTHIPDRLQGRSVLEIACGTGYWTQHIAPRTTRLAATDWTPEPLDFARRRPNTERAVFVQADAYALPDRLGTFEGAFAGLWFSHVPIAGRSSFMRSLHSRLVPGARVLLLDNSEVQCRELPIAERDGDGNTYQWRQLRDGNVHRVLKNFPAERELRALVAQDAKASRHIELENFWLFEYELLGGT